MNGRGGLMTAARGLLLALLCVASLATAGCGDSESEEPAKPKRTDLRSTLADRGLGYEAQEPYPNEGDRPTAKETALTGPNGEVSDAMLIVERYSSAGEASEAAAIYRKELARPEGGRAENVGALLVFVSTSASEGLTTGEIADFDEVVSALRAEG